MRHLRPLLLGLLALAVLVGGPVPVAYAAPFTVTRTDDPVPDGCAAGDCSLREAIIAANASGAADTITVPTGTYTLSIVGVGEQAAATGDLDITDDVTITGAGVGISVIDGGAIDRVFHIDPSITGITVAISGVTIENGLIGMGGGIFLDGGSLTLTDSRVSGNQASAGAGILNDLGANMDLTNVTVRGNTADVWGAGIFNSGTATITGGDISANTAVADDGGGIYNNGIVTLTNAEVSDNFATVGFGGGIRNSGGTVTLTGSTVAGNTSLIGGGIDSDGGSVSLTDSTVIGNTGGTGGGIFSQDALTLTRSTVSGNTAGGGFGGGIYNSFGTATITNSTISGNTSDVGAGIYNPATLSAANSTITDNTAIGAIGFGGGIRNEGPATLKNTIVGSNLAGGDCSAFVPITSNGNNLDSDGTCGLGGPGDLPGAIPLLGPLADNGGPTRTHALLAGSPAIDTGGIVGCPATDQRGVARPLGAGCDIGAYESGDTDADGVPDASDNCPAWPNPGQSLPPWPVPAGDDDCDGFATADENIIGTDPLDACANTPSSNDEADDRWPPDFNDDQVINITDVFEVLPPAFGSAIGDPEYSQRRDLNPDGVINITDFFFVLPPFFGSVCT